MPNPFHYKGLEAFNNSDYEKAKNLFLQALVIDPDLSETNLLLGKSYFFCDEKKNAIVYLTKYIQLNQHNLDENAQLSYAQDLLGQCYEANNQNNAAIRCYKEATKINPSNTAAWNNMGLLYIKLAQLNLKHRIVNSRLLFAQAQSFLNNVLTICRATPMFLNCVATWHEKYTELLEHANEEDVIVKEHFELAIQKYQNAWAACRDEDIGLKNIIQSNLTECFALYGHYLYRSEDYTGAQEFYLLTIQRDSGHLVALSQMGMSLSKQNRQAAARDYFSTILNITEDQQEIADAWLNIACTYRLEHSLEEAKNALNVAKALAPKDRYILAEEQKLRESIAYASLITANQAMFGGTTQEINPQAETEQAETSTNEFMELK